MSNSNTSTVAVSGLHSPTSLSTIPNPVGPVTKFELQEALELLTQTLTKTLEKIIVRLDNLEKRLDNLEERVFTIETSIGIVPPQTRILPGDADATGTLQFPAMTAQQSNTQNPYGQDYKSPN